MSNEQAGGPAGQGGGARGPSLGLRLPNVVKILSRWRWTARRSDQRLREVLCSALEAVGATGMIVWLQDGSEVLSVFVPRRHVPVETQAAYAATIRSRDEARGSPGKNGQVNAVLLDAEYFALAYDGMPDERRDANDRSLVRTAFVFPEKDRKMVQRPSGEYQTIECHSLRAAFLDVMLRREHHLDHVSPCVRARYWSDSAPGTADALRPPWESETPLRTVTLSLDLRKSTFCMKEADSRARFAHWLEDFVQLMRAAAHRHGGVLDKFTGDGVLVHFLPREVRLTAGIDAVSAGVACAIDMQFLMRLHMERLRGFLRTDRRHLGAGIGIDVSDAFWSADRRGNPIVVGRAVVDACRLGDAATAGCILLTNIAYQNLREQQREAGTPDAVEADQVVIATKEHPPEAQVLAWRIRRESRTFRTTPAQELRADWERIVRDQDRA